MKRKIVQISAVVIEDVAHCYALCDDGSLWWEGFNSKNVWNRLPDIPQDEVQPKGGDIDGQE